jgi:hypothetical protein
VKGYAPKMEFAAVRPANSQAAGDPHAPSGGHPPRPESVDRARSLQPANRQTPQRLKSHPVASVANLRAKEGVCEADSPAIGEPRMAMEPGVCEADSLAAGAGRTLQLPSSRPNKPGPHVWTSRDVAAFARRARLA